MSNFKKLKDVFASDIEDVFFNLDELADTYNIDGCMIPVVQDDDRILEKADLSAFGTDLGEGLIFVKAHDLPRIPMGGDQMTINHKKWYVRDCRNNVGVYEIRIGHDQQFV